MLIGAKTSGKMQSFLGDAKTNWDDCKRDPSYYQTNNKFCRESWISRCLLYLRNLVHPRDEELLSMLGERLFYVSVSNPSIKFLCETPIILIGSPTWTPYPGWADVFINVSSVTVPYNSSTHWTQWVKEKRGYEVVVGDRR